MSYYQQQNRHRLSIGQDGNALTLLIAINLIAFVLLAFIKIIYFFSQGNGGTAAFNQEIFQWVALPADLNTFITRPWTLFTHMFVHDTGTIWHILANMLWLWAFGYIFQDLAGNRKLAPLFLYGAFAGALVYMAAYNIIPPLKEHLHYAYACGASAGIMAIAVGATVLAPNYRIFPMLNGGIPLWVITAIYLIIDLATIPYNNAGGHIAHLSGALMGFIFVRRLQKGHDWSLWINNFFDWASNLFNPEKPRKGRVVKSQLFYKAGVKPFVKTPVVTEQKVDEILEKIYHKGYGSLTDDEREVLKRASSEKR